MIEDEEDYNPYCTVCTTRGEDGCCSVLVCSFEVDEIFYNI